MQRRVPVELGIVVSIALVLLAAIVVGWCAAPGNPLHTAERGGGAPTAQLP